MIAFDGEDEVVMSSTMVNHLDLRKAISLLQSTMIYLSVIKENPDVRRPGLEYRVTEARDQLVSKIQSQIGDDAAMLVAHTDLQIKLTK